VAVSYFLQHMAYFYLGDGGFIVFLCGWNGVRNARQSKFVMAQNLWGIHVPVFLFPPASLFKRFIY